MGEYKHAIKKQENIKNSEIERKLPEIEPESKRQKIFHKKTQNVKDKVQNSPKNIEVNNQKKHEIKKENILQFENHGAKPINVAIQAPKFTQKSNLSVPVRRFVLPRPKRGQWLVQLGSR